MEKITSSSLNAPVHVDGLENDKTDYKVVQWLVQELIAEVVETDKARREDVTLDNAMNLFSKRKLEGDSSLCGAIGPICDKVVSSVNSASNEQNNVNSKKRKLQISDSGQKKDAIIIKSARVESKDNFPVLIGNVQNISKRLLQDIMKKCGPLVSWNMSPKAEVFVVCGFGNYDDALRATRLLDGYQILDNKLVVKVDSKTKQLLEIEKEKIQQERRKSLKGREVKADNKLKELFDYDKEQIQHEPRKTLKEREILTDTLVLEQIKYLLDTHLISTTEKTTTPTIKEKGSIEEKEVEKFHCVMCTFCCMSRNELETHTKRHGKVKYQCLHCFDVFENKNSAANHLKTSHKRFKKRAPRWECTICHAHFKDRIAVQKHLILHRESGTKLNSCPICNKSFLSKKRLEAHTDLHHISYKECSICEEFFDVNEDTKTHKCSARQNIRYVSMFEVSNKQHNCFVKQKNKLKAYIIRKYIYHKHKQNKCVQCVKGFTDSKSLKAHLECCSSASITQYNLKNKSTDDSNEMEVKNLYFTCNKCYQFFPSEHTKLTHMQFYHPNYCNLTCSICGESFIKKQVLRKHLETEKCKLNRFYKCHLCVQVVVAFKSYAQLQKHLGSHREANGTLKNNPCSNYVGNGLVSRHAEISNKTGELVYLFPSKSNENKERRMLIEINGFGLFLIKSFWLPPQISIFSVYRFFLDGFMESYRLCKGDLVLVQKKLECNLIELVNPQDIEHSMKNIKVDNTCFKCDITFQSVADIKAHFKQSKCSAQSSDLSPCDQCNLVFVSKSYCLQHKEQFHNNKNPATNSTQVQVSVCSCDQCVHQITCVITSANKYHCLICSTSLPCYKQYKKHLLDKHRLIAIPVCKKCTFPFFDRHDFLQHDCLTNLLGYESANNLMDIYIKPSRQHLCYMCGKSLVYNSQRHCGYHVERKLDCYFCSKRFQLVSDVINHLQLEHGQKPTESRKWLNTIIKGHEILSRMFEGEQYKRGVTPVIRCKVCSMTFYYLSTLCMHRITVHKIGGRQCNICGVLLNRDEIKSHAKWHCITSVDCYICGCFYGGSSVNIRKHLAQYHEIHIIDHPTKVWVSNVVQETEILNYLMSNNKLLNPPNVRCTLCSKYFWYQETFRIHLLKVHKVTRSMLDITDSKFASQVNGKIWPNLEPWMKNKDNLISFQVLMQLSKTHMPQWGSTCNKSSSHDTVKIAPWKSVQHVTEEIDHKSDKVLRKIAPCKSNQPVTEEIEYQSDKVLRNSDVPVLSGLPAMCKYKKLNKNSFNDCGKKNFLKQQTSGAKQMYKGFSNDSHQSECITLTCLDNKKYKEKKEVGEQCCAIQTNNNTIISPVGNAKVEERTLPYPVIYRDCKLRALYNCALCFAVFKSSLLANKHILATHFQRYPNSLDHSPPDSSAVEDLINSLDSPSETAIMYACNLCELDFLSNAACWQHVLKHLDRALYRCVVCQEIFGVVDELRFHLCIVHNCLFCSLCFSTCHTVEELKHHCQLHVIASEMHSSAGISHDGTGMLDVQTDLDPNCRDRKVFLFPHFVVTSKVPVAVLSDLRVFRCQVCEKDCKGELTLIIHMRRHKEHRKLVCLICQTYFVDRESLEKHWKMHFTEHHIVFKIPNQETDHNKSDVNICKICSQVFVYPIELVDHEMIYKDLIQGQDNYRTALIQTAYVKQFCENKINKHLVPKNYVKDFSLFDFDGRLEFPIKVKEQKTILEHKNAFAGVSLLLQYYMSTSLHPEVCHKTCSFKVCLYCHIRLPANETETDHYLKHCFRLGLSKLKCLHCGNFFNINHMCDHVITAHAEKVDFNIPQCPFCLVRRDELVKMDHFKKHVRDAYPLFTLSCAYCRLVFPRQMLAQHVKALHFAEEQGYKYLSVSQSTLKDLVSKEIKILNAKILIKEERDKYENVKQSFRGKKKTSENPARTLCGSPIRLSQQIAYQKEDCLPKLSGEKHITMHVPNTFSPSINENFEIPIILERAYPYEYIVSKNINQSIMDIISVKNGRMNKVVKQLDEVKEGHKLENPKNTYAQKERNYWPKRKSHASKRVNIYRLVNVKRPSQITSVETKDERFFIDQRKFQNQITKNVVYLEITENSHGLQDINLFNEQVNIYDVDCEKKLKQTEVVTNDEHTLQDGKPKIKEEEDDGLYGGEYGGDIDNYNETAPIDISTGDMDNHEQLGKENRQTFPCLYCELSFICLTELKCHLTVHQVTLRKGNPLNMPYPYVCLYCHVGYYRTGQLKQHLLGRHKDIYTYNLEKDKAFLNDGTGLEFDSKKSNKHKASVVVSTSLLRTKNNKNCLDPQPVVEGNKKHLPTRKRKVALTRPSFGKKKKPYQYSESDEETSSSANEDFSDDGMENDTDDNGTEEDEIDRDSEEEECESVSGEITESVEKTDIDTDEVKEEDESIDSELEETVSGSSSGGDSDSESNESNETGSIEDSSASSLLSASSDEQTSDSDEKTVKKLPAKKKYIVKTKGYKMKTKKQQILNNSSDNCEDDDNDKRFGKTTLKDSKEDLLSKKSLCKYCDVVLANDRKLNRHIKLHFEDIANPDDTYYLVCAYCKNYIPRNELILHMHQLHGHLSKLKLRGDVQYCSQCDFLTKSDLEEHVAAEHPEVLVVECRLCGLRFSKQESHKKHLTITHFKSINEKQLTCLLCKKSLKNITMLHWHFCVEHMKKDENCYCAMCATLFHDNKHLLQHQHEFHRKDTFKCALCDARFLRFQDSETHLKKHKVKTNFVCMECNFYFESSDLLDKHTISHGASSLFNSFRNDVTINSTDLSANERQYFIKRLYHCAACKRTFSNFRSIQQHMDHIHFGGIRLKKSICKPQIFITENKSTLHNADQQNIVDQHSQAESLLTTKQQVNTENKLTTEQQKEVEHSSAVVTQNIEVSQLDEAKNTPTAQEQNIAMNPQTAWEQNKGENSLTAHEKNKAVNSSTVQKQNKLEIPMTTHEQNKVENPTTTHEVNRVEILSIVQKHKIVEIPLIVYEQNKEEIPLIAHEQNKVENPPTTHEQNKVEIPSIAQEQNKAEIPSIAQKQNKAGIPSIAQKQNNVEIPSNAQKQNKVDNPPTTHEENKVEYPSIAQKQNKIEIPSIAHEQNNVENPPTTHEQHKVKYPSVAQKQNKAEIPSIAQEQNKVEIPSIVYEQNKLEIPSIAKKENKVEFPSIAHEQNKVENPPTTHEQNKLEYPSIAQTQNKVEIPSIAHEQNKVENPPPTHEQNKVEYPSIAQKKNKAKIPLIAQEQNKVENLPTTHERDKVENLPIVQKKNKVEIPSIAQEQKKGKNPPTIHAQNKVEYPTIVHETE